MSEENNKDIREQFGDSYTASSLGGELGLRGVRKSPSQYLGSRSIEGAIQAWLEIVQNSVDESAELIAFLNSHGYDMTKLEEFQIVSKIYKDDSVVISDTGRGVPAEINEKFGRPVVEAAFEEINVGGKGRDYVEEGMSAYVGNTIGTHGSGAACANATSDYFYVDTYVMKDKKHYRVEWEEAIKTKPTTLIGDSNGRNGTTVSFRPSREVFELYSNKRDGKVDRFYHKKDMIDIIIEYAYNTENICFTFEFENEDGTWDKEVFRSSEHLPEERLKPYLKKDVHHATMFDNELGYKMEIFIGIASTRQFYLTCNMLRLSNGTHLVAIGETINELMPEIVTQVNSQLKEKKINREITERELLDMRIGNPINFASMYVSLFMDDPDYSGQSKEELRVPRLKEPMKIKFKELLDSDLSEFKKEIINEVSRISIINIERYDAHEKEKERKKLRADKKNREKELIKTNDPSYVKGMSEADKQLTRARNQNLKEVILYMVEGETARDAMNAARDTYSESVYAIIQRPPNVLIHNDEKLWAMKRFQEVYKALYGNKNGDYKAIVIATDPDADGSLIRSMIIVFIYKFFPHYLTQGRVFIFKAPKFSAINSKKERALFFSREERDEHQKKYGNESWEYYSYKGLGSIPTEVLRGILDSTDALVQLDKKTVVEGMPYLERFLTDTKYKKQHVLKNYGSNELMMYVQSRKDIIKQQEIEYDINELDTQYTYEPDLSNVSTVTAMERMLAKSISDNKENIEIELNEEEEELLDSVLDDEFDVD